MNITVGYEVIFEHVPSLPLSPRCTFFKSPMSHPWFLEILKNLFDVLVCLLFWWPLGSVTCIFLPTAEIRVYNNRQLDTPESKIQFVSFWILAQHWPYIRSNLALLITRVLCWSCNVQNPRQNHRLPSLRVPSKGLLKAGLPRPTAKVCIACCVCVLYACGCSVSVHVFRQCIQ